MVFPEPVIRLAIEPRTKLDQEKLGGALSKLVREDPTFRWGGDRETGQLLISGMGELHLDVLHTKLTREMGLSVRVGMPRVAYKETISATAEAEGRFIRQTGGRGQYGVVTLSVAPGETASGEAIRFVNEVKQGAIPREYISSVEEGVRDAATSGPLAGYPMTGLVVTLLDGKHHPVDSSEMAFANAGAMAFTSAVERASPVFLEPIMLLEVTAPEAYLGGVTGDLNARRADITGLDGRERYRKLTARVPLSEMFGYTTVLRSLTQGRGTCTLEPLTYAVVPAEVAARLH